jgi:O-acetylhomoserine/O-acetylserine sulfhydrylase-like pyridoxal-dependent enzyme
MPQIAFAAGKMGGVAFAHTHETRNLCLHGGYTPDPTTHSRAVPVYRTARSSSEHRTRGESVRPAELGNIYTRLMNPTTDVLEKRVALLEGARNGPGWPWPPAPRAVFYAIINLAQAGDNIVSARNLYGGTYTQFNDILPALGIEVRSSIPTTRRTSPRPSTTRPARCSANRLQSRAGNRRPRSHRRTSPTRTACR